MASVSAEILSSRVPELMIVDMNFSDADWKGPAWAAVFSASSREAAWFLSVSTSPFFGGRRASTDPCIAGRLAASQSGPNGNFYKLSGRPIARVVCHTKPLRSVPLPLNLSA